MIRLLPLAAALSCFLCVACSPAAERAPSSEPLFSSSLKNLDGQPAPLAPLRGQPLVVNFWARWCPPCLAEIPDLVAAREQFNSQGVQVIGIAAEDDAPGVRTFSVQHGIDYPVFLAGDKVMPIMQALGNPSAGLPFTVVIDRQGNIVLTKLGRLSRQEIDAAFSAALR